MTLICMSEQPPVFKASFMVQYTHEAAGWAMKIPYACTGVMSWRLH
jgi:hypothetical protein